MTAAQNLETPTTTYELIDPDTAKTWLDEANTHNRPISRAYVKSLAADLADGRWQTTHQGVAFDSEGVLADGQHRLWAIVESGVPALLSVTRGLSPKVFEVIDQHRKRTAGQILTMEGISKDAPRFGTMARVLLMTRYGRLRPTQTECIQFAMEHREHIEKFLPVARKHGPACAAAFALASMWGWHEVDDAAARLLALKWTTDGDPVRVLFRSTETQFASAGSGDVGHKTRFAITMNCLLALHENRTMKIARKSEPNYDALEAASKDAQLDLSGEGDNENARPFDAKVRGVKAPRIEYDEEPSVIAAPQSDEEWAEEKERRRIQNENERKALDALLASPAQVELPSYLRK